MHICIFEDKQSDNFYPLSLSHPVYDLLCGMKTLKEKILRYFPEVSYTLFCREYLADTVKLNNPGIEVNKLEDDNYLFINGRVLLNEDLFNILHKNSQEKIFLQNDMLAAARINAETVRKIKTKVTDIIESSLFEGISEERVEADTVSYIWDLIGINGKQLKQDFNYLQDPGISEEARLFRGVHLINKDDIFIGADTVIKPGAVIDASEGPIYIGKHVEINANSVIEGPVSICDNSFVKSCATIKENVSVGKVCKVGGEIEDSIIMPYSNKQHSGFMGHAYLGSWVNIGADTNCSDLKNNYSTIKVNLNGNHINTELQFLGLIMGDHSKTAINTMFNTGTIAGFSCNIFGSGFPDKFIPSFTWGGAEKTERYHVKKSIETAKIVMKRRNVDLTPADEQLFNAIYNLTNESAAVQK